MANKLLSHLRIGFFGAGRMSQAVARSLIERHVVSSKEQIIASDIDENQRKKVNLLKSQSRVIRVMPNIGCLVNAGCSVYSSGQWATSDDRAIVKAIFSSIGSCEDEIDENLLNVVTALSGSGPAYFSVMIEALVDGAVKVGLSRELAMTLALKTMTGTAKVLLDKREQFQPSQLKDAVASPGGTTIYGLQVMEKASIRAATDRAKQLES